MMAGVRSFLRKSAVNHTSQTYRLFVKSGHGIANSSCLDDIAATQLRVKYFQSLVHSRNCWMQPLSAFAFSQNNSSMNLHSCNSCYLVSVSSMSRKYSSFFGSKGEDGPRESVVSVPSVASQSNVDSIDVSGSDWSANLKNTWQSTMDVAIYTQETAEAASNELTPHVQLLLDTYQYLIPVGATLTGTLLAWLVLPKVLRKLHKYSLQGPTNLLTANSHWEQVLYKKSLWSALEDPVRYLVTFMAFSYTGMMIAPTTITPQYIPRAWKGAVIVSSVLFIHRWKTNKLTRALVSQYEVNQGMLLFLDTLSSAGLRILGCIALAKSCGVAVSSFWIVGGIGGVSIAFAARDILRSVDSGWSMKFNSSFSPGDTIKVGTSEGQVKEMGLVTTLSINAEGFQILFPNSLLPSAVNMYISWLPQPRAIMTKIPLRIDDLDKIPQIVDDIKSMMRSSAKTFLRKKASYCFLSGVENCEAGLTIGCNLLHLSENELHTTQQYILLQAAQIIKKHGAPYWVTLQI